ncbi:MAG: hypothetical protein KKD17_04980 [Nanoarchaeota archaeon]|nr:hypothetical protein [Nanoarchaeota archaeon]
MTSILNIRVIKMSRLIDLEREFFKAAKDLEKKSQVKQEFLVRVNKISEDWINDELRWDIAGLKD